MNTNVNLGASLGALALLGTGLLFFVAALVLVQSLLARKPGRVKFMVILIVILAVGYVVAVLAFSFAGHDKVLARGEEKYFCEIDCHLAYSVVGTRQVKTAQGVFTVVTIKTRFDETTISPHRGNGVLFPNSRVLTLSDEHGNRYAPAADSPPGVAQNSTPLTAPLRPGESYTTDLVFSLPADVKVASLLINEGDWMTHLIIGHENSPRHGKTRFKVEV